ncbi:hypothetical protein K9M59_00445 [Candidatus Gracilibacteria bacterium]|nr:hypothetical protein [Candidatus Gracilibacteria bacterium]MCF7819050.1 hypothetical protein [Candidatus Gracilibacteria bacterium]
MNKFVVRSFVFTFFVFAPGFVFAAQNTGFYPHRSHIIRQNSRSVRTTLMQTEKFTLQEQKDARKLFAGLSRRSRSLQESQVRTVLNARERTLSRQVQTAMERTNRYEKGTSVMSSPIIRGKNISIVHFQGGEKSVSMDQYIQGTRRDFGAYIVQQQEKGRPFAFFRRDKETG